MSTVLSGLRPKQRTQREAIAYIFTQMTSATQEKYASKYATNGSSGSKDGSQNARRSDGH